MVDNWYFKQWNLVAEIMGILWQQEWFYQINTKIKPKYEILIEEAGMVLLWFAPRSECSPELGSSWQLAVKNIKSESMSDWR